jgi:hypothetical protein
MLERALAQSLHVPMAWIVVPSVGLEIVAMVFVLKALINLKAGEAAEKGSAEA